MSSALRNVRQIFSTEVSFLQWRSLTLLDQTLRENLSLDKKNWLSLQKETLFPEQEVTFYVLLTLLLTRGGGHTCSQAHVGGSDLFSVMSKRMGSL